MLTVGTMARSIPYGGYGLIVMEVDSNEFIIEHPKGWVASKFGMSREEAKVLTIGKRYLYCSNKTAVSMGVLRKENTCSQ